MRKINFNRDFKNNIKIWLTRITLDNLLSNNTTV